MADRHYPTVYALEPTNGDWLGAQANRWGDTFKGPIPAEGKVQEITRLDRIPGPPRVYTVQLFRSDIDPSSTATASVRARVTYGVGAVSNSFDCDWLTGGQFSLVASSLKVEAVFYNASVNASYSTNNENILLGASYGAGSVGHNAPICYTDNILVATMATEYIQVPDFARAISVRAYDAGSLATNFDPQTLFNVTALFRTGSAGTVARTDVCQFAGVEKLALPGGVSRVGFSNTRANNVIISSQFWLAL